MGMKTITVAMLALGALLAAPANSAPAAATDALTNLPVPPDTALPLGEATKLDDGRVCKSVMKGDFYKPTSGQLDQTVAWYAARLNGFKRTHGYWAGHTQDTFYNATGTLLVAVTGTPAKEGENTAVYSVLYAKVEPGFAEKTIQSLNAPQVVCP
jgi:hypothetical protein